MSKLLKVAVVNDWLVTYAGAERVLKEIIDIYPEADIYSVIDFLSEKSRAELKIKDIKTTFIQHLPFAKKISDVSSFHALGNRATRCVLP
jgi:hypothetical protein